VAVSVSGAQTLTNKTINLANNTLTATSAQIAAAVSDETGTGALVFASSPALAGTPTAPTAATSTNTTQLATTAFVQAIKASLHPVGSIYINATDNTDPATLLGFGTWTAFGAGRVPVGFDAADPLFNTAEETGGSKNAIVVSHTHTATVTDPGHTHPIGWDLIFASGSGNNGARPVSSTITNVVKSAETGITVSNSTTGSSGTNANLQPYITVYMWKRVS
jgi:hypothetical protein